MPEYIELEVQEKTEEMAGPGHQHPHSIIVRTVTRTFHIRKGDFARLVQEAMASDLVPAAKVPFPGELEKREIERAEKRAHLRATEQKQIDDGGQATAEIADGPLCPGDVPTIIAIDPKMPVGAKMFVAGFMYELRQDRKLYFLPIKKGEKDGD